MEDFIKNHITYHKINTLYKRDPITNNIIIGAFSVPEIEYLYNNKWSCEEKIDGTNVFVFWDGYHRESHGKTENANIPPHVIEKMNELFSEDKLREVFPPQIDEKGNNISPKVRIYGEAYGVKIQKGGNYISNGCNIRIFDILIDSKWWLKREDIENIATLLNVEVIPVMGIMTLQEAEEMVKNGFKSTIAQNKDYDAEGLVCKPMHQLFDRMGKRIICKIKTVDYKKLK